MYGSNFIKNTYIDMYVYTCWKALEECIFKNAYSGNCFENQASLNIWNPSACEPEAGGSLVSGQTGLRSQF